MTDFIRPHAIVTVEGRRFDSWREDGLIAASVEMGAILGHIPAEGRARLRAYAHDIGLAFQIADDVMDLTGDERTAGKTLGTDAAQQKLTLPVIHCLSKLPTHEAIALRNNFNSPRATDFLASAITKTGSLAHARYRADEFAKAAIAELDELVESPAKELLLRLPEWAVKRDH